MSKKGREVIFKFFKQITTKEPTKIEVKHMQKELKLINEVDNVTATYAYHQLHLVPRKPLLFEMVKSLLEKDREEEASLRHLVVSIMVRKKYVLPYTA